MDGSWTIRVIKRDGCAEDFDAPKLAAAMYRAMPPATGGFHRATQLALAIEVYLARTGIRRISSAAILEMAVKVLRSVGESPAAAAMEAYSAWRSWRRKQLRVRHDGGQETLCDKAWLAELACRGWGLAPQTGRIIAAQIERDLLGGVPARRGELGRDEVQDRINQRVAEFGLADAVPALSRGAGTSGLRTRYVE